jgi:hypothetical protein
MLRGLFEWWAGLRWWIRASVAGAFLLLSTVILLCGRLWIWGWIVGAVLLVFSFPSKPERKGYHDF